MSEKRMILASPFMSGLEGIFRVNDEPLKVYIELDNSKRIARKHKALKALIDKQREKDARSGVWRYGK